MIIQAKTANGYLVDATLKEINTISGLQSDRFNFGDEIDVITRAAKTKALEDNIIGVATFVSSVKTAISDFEKNMGVIQKPVSQKVTVKNG